MCAPPSPSPSPSHCMQSLSRRRGVKSLPFAPLKVLFVRVPFQRMSSCRASNASTDVMMTEGGGTDDRIEWVFDGECPLCVELKTTLEERDSGHAIGFTDFTSQSYDEEAHGNLPIAELRTDIHVLRWRGGSEEPEVYRGLAALALLETIVPTPEGVTNAFDSVLESFDEEGGCEDEECNDVWNKLSEESKAVRLSYDEDEST